eukprot:scaffold97086_cov17-Tisochrysis_lutea.AAC.1
MHGLYVPMISTYLDASQVSVHSPAALRSDSSWSPIENPRQDLTKSPGSGSSNARLYNSLFGHPQPEPLIPWRDAHPSRAPDKSGRGKRSTIQFLTVGVKSTGNTLVLWNIDCGAALKHSR